jgi:uncharacterized protein (TIGR02246 family)
MSTNNPEGALHAFFHAFNQRDFEGVMALYEPQAIMVPQPGQIAEGQAALRDAVRAFLAMKATLALEKHKILTTGDLALTLIKWSLKGTDPNGQAVQLAGTSSDVLRKQPDGRWLFVIDNPWGAGLLG